MSRLALSLVLLTVGIASLGLKVNADGRASDDFMYPSQDDIVALFARNGFAVESAPPNTDPQWVTGTRGGCRMQIANVSDRLVTFVGGATVDVAEASGGRFGPDPMSVWADWDAFVAWGGSIGASGPPAELDDGIVGPPVPRPAQVFAIGLNYRAHALEGPFGIPDQPAVFTKWPACLSGPRDAVTVPTATTDYEVELVFAIARRAYRVRRDDAWSYVAGYTIGQDLSERTMQRAGPAPQFGLGKSWAGFGPTGPALVTLDEVPDRHDLRLSTTIDGETLQDSRTSDLIFDVAFLVEHLSAVLPLQAGDLVFTGTPSGVGAARTPPRFLRAGETILSRIDGLGELRTRLV